MLRLSSLTAVYTNEVKGSPPNPFLLNALKQASPWRVHQL